MATGIRRRGSAWEAFVYDRRTKTKIRRTFRNYDEARSWRHDAAGAVKKGTLKPATRQTLRAAGEALIAGMKEGSIRKRDGQRYKPSVIRGYEALLEQRVYPELGACGLSELRRNDLQDFVAALQAVELDPSTIRNVLMPVRTIYRRALKRGEVALNPTLGLDLPALEGKRDRVASPEEAARLLAALPEADRPLWATVFYGGLRMGELRGPSLGERRARRRPAPRRALLGQGRGPGRAEEPQEQAHGADPERPARLPARASPAPLRARTAERLRVRRGARAAVQLRRHL
jgi:hypothetical protein